MPRKHHHCDTSDSESFKDTTSSRHCHDRQERKHERRQERRERRHARRERREDDGEKCVRKVRHGSRGLPSLKIEVEEETLPPMREKLSAARNLVKRARSRVGEYLSELGEPASGGSLLDLIQGNHQTQIFASLCRQNPNFAQWLENHGGTAFVPSDTAWGEAMPHITLTDAKELTSSIWGHLSNQVVPPHKLHARPEIASLHIGGGKLKATPNGVACRGPLNLHVKANIIGSQNAKNGVLYVIDKAFVPPKISVNVNSTKPY